MVANKIAVVSIASGNEFRANVAACIDSQQSYCRRHGYRNIHLTSSDSEGRPPSWGKVKALIRILNEQPDVEYLFWIDADALITNPFFRLETLCEKLDKSKRTMFVTVDGGGNINLGVFLMKRTPHALLILEGLWKQEQFINHCWWEGGAIFALYPHIFQAMLVTRENRLFNSYLTGEQPWGFGDFVLHFAGMGGDARKALSDRFYHIVRLAEPLLPRP